MDVPLPDYEVWSQTMQTNDTVLWVNGQGCALLLGAPCYTKAQVSAKGAPCSLRLARGYGGIAHAQRKAQIPERGGV